MPDDVDVLVISPPTSVWGAQLRLLDYAPALADRGVRLTLGSLPEGALYEAWVASDLPHREVAIPFLAGFRDEETDRRLSPREAHHHRGASGEGRDSPAAGGRSLRRDLVVQFAHPSTRRRRRAAASGPGGDRDRRHRPPWIRPPPPPALRRLRRPHDRQQRGHRRHPGGQGTQRRGDPPGRRHASLPTRPTARRCARAARRRRRGAGRNRRADRPDEGHRPARGGDCPRAGRSRRPTRRDRRRRRGDERLRA